MNIGFWQLILILLVILVLFGAGRISKVMGELGKGVRAFKEGLEGKKTASKSPPTRVATKKRPARKKAP